MRWADLPIDDVPWKPQWLFPALAEPVHKTWNADIGFETFESDETSTAALSAQLPRTPSSSVLELALQAEGSRRVQADLDGPDKRKTAGIAAQLRGHVQVAVASPHGNYVIQKLVEVLGRADGSFVEEELFGAAVWAARHRFGCRVVIRLMEHRASVDIAPLVEEILPELRSLICGRFAHYVVEALLVHGAAPWKSAVVAALLVYGATRAARHKYARFVVQRALNCCEPSDCELLVDDLLCTDGGVKKLARHSRGVHVLDDIVRYFKRTRSTRGLDI